MRHASSTDRPRHNRERRRDRNDEESDTRSSHRHRHRRRHRSRSRSVDESRNSRREKTSHDSRRTPRKDEEQDTEIRSPRDQGQLKSRHDDHHRSKRRSRSPKRHHRSKSRSASPTRRSRKPLPSQEVSYQRDTGGQPEGQEPAAEKQKPNFKPTGLLAAETNKVSIGAGNEQKSIVLKYHEPPEARKPSASEKWSLFIFKGASQEPLDTIPLHSRSCWLLGREAAVADIPTEHPSCSKQHAVFQFRHTVKKDEWGEKKDKVGLYVLDLESANGTFLNGEQIEPARYVQCMNGDIFKFGESTREYVIILPPKE